MLLSIVGFGISIYLLMVHWSIIGQAVCLGVGDCQYVNTSIYSELFGVPVALLGALTYVAFVALIALIGRGIGDDVTRLAMFFVAVIGLLFSLYLTYIEVYVLHEICPWCVFSAIVITFITALAFLELREWQAAD